MNQTAKKDIRYLKGVGEVRAQQFQRLGIETVDDLLHLYPRRYIDLSDIQDVATAPLGELVAVAVTVERKLPAVRLSGGRTVYKATAFDDSGALEIVIFNSRFAMNALKEGARYILYGKLSGSLLRREITNPLIVNESAATPLIPQYPATEGLSSKVIAKTVQTALALHGDDIAETLPQEVLDRYELLPLKQAVLSIHAPKSQTDAADARRRLIFEELLTLQLGMLMLKDRNRKKTSSVVKTNDASAFIKTLPFALTAAQLRCIDEIGGDLAKTQPMNRLLQGDVGSGKTVVAAAAVYCCFKSGMQSAMMAPTELLARQHAETLEGLLAPLGVRIGLLTGSVKGAARKLFYEKLASGEIDLAIGTHAMITPGVAFKNLGLVVADEQHRFGVEQRALLIEKGDNPHVLVMSATPIPRTLALIIYGDLDISVIDEMPAGRKPVRTFLVNDSYRARYLNFVRKAVDSGHQAYIVCPLIDESEQLGETLAATQYKEVLEKDYLKGLRIGLVHGKLKPAEKNDTMAQFASGALDVLVSTTVIEVGLDVPNATIIVIENAERFGLSELHQLRGRVGRSEAESFCILVSPQQSGASADRLRVLTETNDGFKIAKSDLATRGPGDFFGKRQHGLPELRIADLAADESVLYDVQSLAKELLARDERLSSAELKPLRRAVDDMFSQLADIPFN